MRRTIFLGATMAAVSASAQQSRSVCSATASSLTPGRWRSPAVAATTQPRPGLTIVFDADRGKVITEIMDLPRATGVLAVPSHHQVYVSTAGAHQVAIIDDRALKVTSRVGGMQFPDAIAYAREADKVFVSDESGGTDVVIDPVTERIVQRYDLPGSDHPHGFTLDEEGRLAFISGEGNSELQVVDLRTMKVIQTLKVPDDPDALAWDASWRRLYIAAESGVLAAYWLDMATAELTK